MWSPNTLSKLAALRRDELLKQAERERVARQLAANTARSVPLADRVLDWTGQQLIAIGRRMQSNHRAVKPSATLRTAQRNR